MRNELLLLLLWWWWLWVMKVMVVVDERVMCMEHEAAVDADVLETFG